MNVSRDIQARPAQPVRPSLQALQAASALPTLSEALDDFDEVMASFTTDLNALFDRLAPVMHAAEDDPVPQPSSDPDDAAPAVARVQDARRRLSAMHDQVFEIASRIAL